jgi:hypothetical protein
MALSVIKGISYQLQTVRNAPVGYPANTGGLIDYLLHKLGMMLEAV